MFHGCAIRGVTTALFCFIFVAYVIMLLCSTIITAIKNKNNNLSFKKIIKKSFSVLMDAGLSIGLYILAICFVVMVIAIPISSSKKHAFKEMEHYRKIYSTLSKEINEVNNSKENIPKKLKSYDMILLDKKNEELEEAERELDYWYDIINE